MTNKRERIQAAIAGERVDRPPVALWRHFPVDDQDPAALAESTWAFQTDYDFDFIKVTPASSFCVRDWGVEDRWQGSAEGTREYTGRAIQDPQDWQRLQPLDPRAGSLAAQLRCLELLLERSQGSVPIIQTIFSPLAQAKNLAGQDRLFEHLHQAPQAVEEGLATIAETTVAFIEQLRALGIDGIFYAVQHASFRYFDRQSYARFGERFDRQIMDAARGFWLNVLHLHGEALIFELAEVLPAQVVNWHDRSTPPSLIEGKARLRGAVCGGLRRWETMVLGDPQSVRSEAREAIDATEGGRGLILGTGCVVPVIAPRANLRAAREAVDFA